MDKQAKFDENSDRFHGTKAVVAATSSPSSRPSSRRCRSTRIARCACGTTAASTCGSRETGEIYVIEVNASCYLEEQSEFAVAAAAHGISIPSS